MADLYRLMAPLLIAAAYWFAGDAQAAFPATPSSPLADQCTGASCTLYRYTASDLTNSPSGPYRRTPLEACQALAGVSGEHRFRPGVRTYTTMNFTAPQTCRYTLVPTASGYSFGESSMGTTTGPAFTPVYSCPSGSTLSGQSCTCNAPLVQQGNSCVDVQAQFCSTLSGQDTFITSSGQRAPGSTVCLAIGCQGTLSDTLIRVRSQSTGQWETKGDAVITATPCTYSASTGAAPTTCNGTQGTVNGVSVCVDYDPAQNTIETITKEREAATTTQQTASGVTTGTPTSTNTETTRATTCQAGACNTTITTTTVNPDGTRTVREATETQPRESFCQENPTFQGCQSGKFSGTCSAGFTCEGDAIQCAIARSSYDQLCALTADSDEAQQYTQAKTQTGSVTANLPGNTTTAIGPSSINQTSALGAGACIADLNITVMGSAISLPFSDLCPVLAQLGNLLTAVSLLIAARILMRG